MSIPDSPVRPERSSARTSAAHSMEGGGGGGMAGAASNGLAGLGNAASGAYSRAPDLGISSTANSAYQRAPDLGVGSTINAYFGGNRQQQVGGGDDLDDERVIRPKDKEDAEQQTYNSSTTITDSETLREESQRVGPSDQSRIGKTQQEIGTETGIPTAAGAGTTASADRSNIKALEKAESEGRVNEAHVPEDYEALPCPTENAGSGKSKNVVYNDGEGKTSYSSNNGSPHNINNHHESSNNTYARSSGSHNRQSSDKRNSSSQRGGHMVTTSDGNEYEVEKRRSFGEKIKDQVKGEMKILAGTVTGSDEKVMQGLAIKHGEHN